MKAKVRRLEEDNEILRRAPRFSSPGSSPPQPLIVAFIDEMRTEGHAVEPVCRVLREQGCQIAARTYREWRRPDRPVAARTFSDAIVFDRSGKSPGPLPSTAPAGSPRKASTDAAR